MLLMICFDFYIYGSDAFGIFTIGSVALAAILFQLFIASPFKKIKAKFKSTLLDEFMHEYHPKLNYHYSSGKKDVEYYVRNSNLISASKYKESDVIRGKLKNIQYYISDISLSKRSGKSERKVFGGILFHLTVPGKNYPSTKIKAYNSVKDRLFTSYSPDAETGLYYETVSETEFRKELAPIIPFISYLKQRHGNIMVNAHENELTILLGTGMNIMDEPVAAIDDSFLDQAFYEGMGRQINTLLYMVESFADDLAPSEIQKTLELKSLETLKAEAPNQKLNQ